MQAGIVGPSAVQFSLPFNAERTVNYLVVTDQDGKTPAALISRPGLNSFDVVGSGPGRCGINSSNGRVFTVSGNNFFEVMSDGTSIDYGLLDN